ncbi:Asp23/Gls24 family envelope stress response protein [Corynebacterium uterequi]|uniref:Asp23 family n=1 Tax=Corynebacterium uterequi TaxID=1072256 RepID=A0A0G3HAH6_9CORY|nr:Asp23/Gls24 family envelope stress response protein [Corynebacterium uterequi]AKK10334.1 hypothetical protein CUTER_01590 [Corynebacterium uterequi]
MSGRNDFSDRVFTTVINNAAAAVPGVETITSTWTDIGTRSYPRCDFRVEPEGQTVQVDSYLAVSWPAPVTDVAAQAQRTIQRWLEEMLGYTATQINVTVEQTVPSSRRVSLDDVRTHPHDPELGTIAVTPLVAEVLPATITPTVEVYSPVTTNTVDVYSPETADGIEVYSPETADGIEVYSPETADGIEVYSPETADGIEVYSPETADGVEVYSPETADGIEVYSPETAEPAALVGIVAPEDVTTTSPVVSPTQVWSPAEVPERPLTPVRDPKAPAPVRVDVPRQHPLVPIREPRALTARSIRVPRKTILSVRAPEPLPIYHPQPPREWPLRPISVNELAPTKTVTATPLRVRPVTVAPAKEVRRVR